MSIKIWFASIVLLTLAYVVILIMAWSERNEDVKTKKLEWSFSLLVARSSLFNKTGKKLRIIGALLEVLIIYLWIVFLI